MKRYFWVCNTILFITFAQLSLKLGINILNKTSFFNEQWKNIFWIKQHIKIFIPILIGIILHIFSMISWLFTLKFFSLSQSYLLLSLSYILVYLLSINLPLLHETGSITKFIGIMFILFGIYLSLKKNS